MKTFLIYKHGKNPNFIFSFKEVSKKPNQLLGLVKCVELEAEPTKEQMELIFQSGDPVSVEQWTEKQGFTALRMLTIKDLEGKLATAGKESVKLSAIRQWADSLIALFATNPEPRNDWPEAPFSFDETVQEAVSLLV